MQRKLAVVKHAAKACGCSARTQVCLESSYRQQSRKSTVQPQWIKHNRLFGSEVPRQRLQLSPVRGASASSNVPQVIYTPSSLASGRGVCCINVCASSNHAKRRSTPVTLSGRLIAGSGVGSRQRKDLGRIKTGACEAAGSETYRFLATTAWYQMSCASSFSPNFEMSRHILEIITPWFNPHDVSNAL